MNSSISPVPPPSIPPDAAPSTRDAPAVLPAWREAALCAAAGVLLSGAITRACTQGAGVLAMLWVNGLALPLGGTGVAVLVLGSGHWRGLPGRLALPLAAGRSARAVLGALGTGLGAFLLAIPLVLLCLHILSWFGADPPPNHFVELLASHPRLDVWLSVSLLVVVVAPFAEEILFRVVVVEAFRAARFPVPAILSALLFAAAHGRIDQFPSLCVLALWLYRLRVQHDSLRPAILAHATFNLLALTGAFLQATRT